MQRVNAPPGYSTVTIRILGKDVPLATVSDDMLQGFQKILSSLKKGPPVIVRMPNGKKVVATVKKRMKHVTVLEVGGKEILAREVKNQAPPPVRRMITTKVTVEK